jgi:hypothetical protein
LPHLKKVYEEQYRNDPDVAFVLVSMDDDLRRVKRYTDELQFPFPVDHSSLDQAEKLYKVTDTPTTFYIDRTGVIRYVARGNDPHGDADARIRWFIEELKKR